jgi:hypothetical protein
MGQGCEKGSHCVIARSDDAISYLKARLLRTRWSLTKTAKRFFNRLMVFPQPLTPYLSRILLFRLSRLFCEALVRSATGI